MCSSDLDASDIRISVVTTAIAMQTINTCQDAVKLPNSPPEPEKWPTNDQAKSRNRAGTPNTCGQSHTVGRHAKMVRDTRNRRYSIADSKRSDLPGGSTRSCAEGTQRLKSPAGAGRAVLYSSTLNATSNLWAIVIVCHGQVISSSVAVVGCRCHLLL